MLETATLVAPRNIEGSEFNDFGDTADQSPETQSEMAFDAQTLGASTIMIVDDTETLRERLATAMTQRGFKVTQAGTFGEALTAFRESPTELAVVDLRMPGKSGLELLRELLRIKPDVRVIMFSGFGSIPLSIDAIRAGAVNFLPKPADADDILGAFHRGDGPSVPPGVTSFPAPSLARNEWEHIHRVLRDCDGNISEAARRLGIHRRSLQRKLRKRAPEDPQMPNPEDKFEGESDGPLGPLERRDIAEDFEN